MPETTNNEEVKKKEKKQTKFSYKFYKTWVPVVNALIIHPLLRQKYVFVGDTTIDTIPDDKLIYSMNHYTMFDFMTVLRLKKKSHITVVAKKELENTPLIGYLLKKGGVIFVDRNNADARSLMDMMKVLKENRQLCIYPEGTRNKTDEELLPFANGAVSLAIKNKAPILPLMYYKKVKFFRRNIILIGDPFELDEFYGQKMKGVDYDRATEILRSKMIELKEKYEKMLAEEKERKAAEKAAKKSKKVKG